MTLKTNYIKEIRKQLGFWPTWLPGTPIELGAIGLIKENEFRQVTNLKNKELDYEFVKDNPVDLDYKSYGGVEVKNKLAGQAQIPDSSLAEIDAGIIVNFDKEEAVVLKTKKMYVEVIEDIDGIGELIIDRFKRGKWQDDWVVITEVMRAKSAAILISRSKNSKLELKANLKANQILDIADAEIQFQTLTNSGLETSIIAKKGITIGFKMWGIKKKFFGGAKFEPKGITYNQKAIEQEEFEPIFEEI